MSNADSTRNNGVGKIDLFNLRPCGARKNAKKHDSVNDARNVNKIYKNSAVPEWYNIMKECIFRRSSMKNVRSTLKKIFTVGLKSLPVIAELFIFALAHKTSAVDKDSFVFYLLNILTIALTVVFVCVKTDKLKPVAWAVFALAPAASFLLLESMIRNPFEIKPQIIFLNMAILYLVSFFLFFLTGRTAPSVFAVSLYGFVAGLTEHFVLIFRDAPLFPWDLASLKTAASVVDNYEFDVPYSLSASVCALIMLMTLAFTFKARFSLGDTAKQRRFKTKETNAERRTSFIVRSVASFLVAAILGGTVYYVNLDRSYTDFKMYPYLFTPKVVYSRNGFTVAFLSMLRYVTVSKPDGYSDELLETLKNESAEAADVKNGDVDLDSVTPTGEMPDIIVIMNEAFSDLSVLTEFETNEDYMPFLRSLTENTVKGNLHVSVLGGNTANTEFEFLTGCSMAFLPTGSIPYQQYIKSETPSLASQLKSLGYETLALHPYNTKGWNRNTVYPDLGIDQSVFKINMGGQYALARQYVTDLSCYRYFLRHIRQSETDAPKFIFNVTMQNHGSYTTVYDNFDHTDITATGLESDVKLSTYLSLIKKSDDAMRYLLEQLESSDRPTIVCMFGDHQPAATVSSKLLKKYGVTINDEDITQLEQRYIVPFYIWANYDIEEAEYDAISVNYLSTLLMQTAGLPLTDAQAFLSELFTEYPVITANAFMTADGALHSSDEMNEHERLSEYASLQYSCLFDGDEYGMFSYSPDSRYLSYLNNNE